MVSATVLAAAFTPETQLCPQHGKKRGMSVLLQIPEDILSSPNLDIFRSLSLALSFLPFPNVAVDT